MTEKVNNGETISLPLTEKDAYGNDVLTAEGHRRVGEYVTSTTNDVYAIFGLSEQVEAAAMGRLSRSSNDFRVILAKEFLDNEEYADRFHERVLNEYGDDSIKQLGGGQGVIVENASNLLTKQLEWGRLAGYLEQSTRYIFYDRRDSEGNFRYFKPDILNSKTEEFYASSMDTIFTLYSEVVRDISGYFRSNFTKPQDLSDHAWRNITRAKACDLARSMLPVATKSTVAIKGSAHTYENLIFNLLSSDSLEAKQVGNKILASLREIMPALFTTVDLPTRGNRQVQYKEETRKGVAELSPRQFHSEVQPLQSEVELLSYYPLDELELIPHMLYKSSNMSFRQLQQEVKGWSQEELIGAFKTYAGDRSNRRHKPDRAIEVAQYIWDITCDYGIFRDLQRHRIVDALEWQDLHPYFGFDIPNLIKETGHEDSYDTAYKLSLDLYRKLLESGNAYEAQYATLLGHKMRWKVAFNAREAFHLLELRTQMSGHEGYRLLCQQMYQAISLVHPNLASQMIYIDMSQSQDLLGRLDEEKRLEEKRRKIGKSTISYDDSDK